MTVSCILRFDPADVGADDWTGSSGELAGADDSTDDVDTVTGINRVFRTHHKTSLKLKF